MWKEIILNHLIEFPGEFSIPSHQGKQTGGNRRQNEPNNDTNGTNNNQNESEGKHDRKEITFNYSKCTLSEAMKSLVNKALNFAVLPIKLYITEVIVDFNRFARAAVWQEYWYGKEKDDNYQKSIFKTMKNNLPKN